MRLTIRDTEGRTVAMSVPLTGDGTRTSVVWNHGMRPPVGRSVSLRFELDRAEVYAVECLNKE